MSKRKEESNGAKSIKILTGIVLFLQTKLFLDVVRRKKKMDERRKQEYNIY